MIKGLFWLILLLALLGWPQPLLALALVVVLGGAFLGLFRTPPSLRGPRGGRGCG